MKYCAKCGNTGVLLDGTKCECRYGIEDVYTEVTCMEIPEQYRGINLLKDMIPDVWNGAYQGFLDNLHSKISTCEEKGTNYLICSPPRHSKTIFVYATMRRLFKGRIDILPYSDMYELKDQIICADDRSPLCSVPYLFVRFPDYLTEEVFQLASTLLCKRVRHSTTTIFIYNGTWEKLRALDKYSNFTAYAGDGALCSVKVSSWKGGENN